MGDKSPEGHRWSYSSWKKASESPFCSVPAFSFAEITIIHCIHHDPTESRSICPPSPSPSRVRTISSSPTPHTPNLIYTSIPIEQPEHLVRHAHPLPCPLATHIVFGLPEPVILRSKEEEHHSPPSWSDRLTHFNPVSILWRYYSIADRRFRATRIRHGGL